ncbi:class F sortase [Nitriliruptor alkaliphilus]|uniref:class F sortase n=1 Tax=Nitriliruptor alkaliphilus TaxID=427918 RepID=UPI000697F909|nr:class F sortase [Nitriliruptor alkaliphilus]
MAGGAAAVVAGVVLLAVAVATLGASPAPGPWDAATALDAPGPSDAPVTETGTETGAGATPPAEVEVEAVTVSAEGGRAERQAPVPVRLRVPALGIDAVLAELGLRGDGTLGVPDDAMVPGWWAGGSAPGERGPAVIVGHVDSHVGDGIFRHLDRLEPGDVVVIDREDGTRAHFRAAFTEVHRKDAFPTTRVYGATSTPQLRLITCGGDFDRDQRSYEDNVIVYLALEGWSS